MKPRQPSSFPLLTAAAAAVLLTAVVAIPDVTIPIEPIDNTGGNQCYDEHNIPQVRPAHANGVV